MRKKIPHFKEGDEIYFEVDPSGHHPRYDLNRDRGYSGKYAKGVILEVDCVAIKAFGLFPDQKGREVVFPNIDSSDYEPDQWTWHGYLKHIEEAAPPCDCGCKGLGYHWNFCQYQKWMENASKKV